MIDYKKKYLKYKKKYLQKKNIYTGGMNNKRKFDDIYMYNKKHTEVTAANCFFKEKLTGLRNDTVLTLDRIKLIFWFDGKKVSAECFDISHTDMNNILSIIKWLPANQLFVYFFCIPNTLAVSFLTKNNIKGIVSALRFYLELVYLKLYSQGKSTKKALRCKAYKYILLNNWLIIEYNLFCELIDSNPDVKFVGGQRLNAFFLYLYNEYGADLMADLLSKYGVVWVRAHARIIGEILDNFTEIIELGHSDVDYTRKSDDGPIDPSAIEDFKIFLTQDDVIEEIKEVKNSLIDILRDMGSYDQQKELSDLIEFRSTQVDEIWGTTLAQKLKKRGGGKKNKGKKSPSKKTLIFCPPPKKYEVSDESTPLLKFVDAINEFMDVEKSKTKLLDKLITYKGAPSIPITGDDKEELEIKYALLLGHVFIHQLSTKDDQERIRELKKKEIIDVGEEQKFNVFHTYHQEVQGLTRIFTTLVSAFLLHMHHTIDDYLYMISKLSNHTDFTNEDVQYYLNNLIQYFILCQGDFLKKLWCENKIKFQGDTKTTKPSDPRPTGISLYRDGKYDGQVPTAMDRQQIYRFLLQRAADYTRSIIRLHSPDNFQISDLDIPLSSTIGFLIENEPNGFIEKENPGQYPYVPEPSQWSQFSFEGTQLIGPVPQDPHEQPNYENCDSKSIFQ